MIEGTTPTATPKHVRGQAPQRIREATLPIAQQSRNSKNGSFRQAHSIKTGQHKSVALPFPANKRASTSLAFNKNKPTLLTRRSNGFFHLAHHRKRGTETPIALPQRNAKNGSFRQAHSIKTGQHKSIALPFPANKRASTSLAFNKNKPTLLTRRSNGFFHLAHHRKRGTNTPMALPQRKKAKPPLAG